MGKSTNNAEGSYHEKLFSHQGSIESSRKLINYVTEQFRSFDAENRIITSAEFTVNFCNTNDTSVQSYRSSNTTIAAKDILSITTMSVEGSDFVDSEDTIRRRVICYFESVCTFGMMNVSEYERFVKNVTDVYCFLTSISQSVYNINEIINVMNLPYEIKNYPPTVACPDQFYKLVHKQNTDSDNVEVTGNKEAIAKKLDEFMKRWFIRGNGKIYDKDRDEFYMEFVALMESASDTGADEKGTIPVYRKSQSNHSKKVMAMQKLPNYAEINQVLKNYGLNYNIVYKQEVNQTESGIRRRNSLSLKDEIIDTEK